MYIAITGGAGYVGGHLTEYFAALGYKVVVIDNLSLSQQTPSYSEKNIYFENVDICEFEQLDKVFLKYDISIVIHCAGKLGINNSINEPEKYYSDNVVGSIVLLSCMVKHGVKKIIFSSSAAVYKEQVASEKIDEEYDIDANTPYARTKHYIEEIIKDYYMAGYIDAIIFRFFNVVGCSSNRYIANIYIKKGNLLPNLIKKCSTDRCIKVYGNNYGTWDGTCVRDYIDIRDLCYAHMKAFNSLMKNRNQYHIINICGNRGYSVIEFIEITEKILNLTYDVEYVANRKGDQQIMIGANHKAYEVLGWSPKYSLEETIITTVTNLKEMDFLKFKNKRC